MGEKKQKNDSHIRQVRALPEVGEILYAVLTPEEKRTLQSPGLDINEIDAKRRYRRTRAA